MRNLAVFMVVLAGFISFQEQAPVSISELTRQAEAGNAEAQFQLGLAWEKGQGVQPNDEGALQWYRKAAEQGSARARNKIGVMYSMGHGVAQDKSEALRWYKKAAMQGLADADYNVAISCFNGDGTELDPVRAQAWMLLAQRNGDPRAAEALSRMAQESPVPEGMREGTLAKLFETGTEVPQEWKSALDIYVKLAKESSPGLVMVRPSLYLKICQIQAVDKPGLPHDYEAAKSWCQKAADKGTATGDVILGRMAEQGIGSPKDLKEAERHYHAAAQRGSMDGFMELGRVKLQSGSHSDEVEAYYWFYLAKLFKVPGAEAQAQVAAQHLSEKEIRNQRKKAEERSQQRFPTPR